MVIQKSPDRLNCLCILSQASNNCCVCLIKRLKLVDVHNVQQLSKFLHFSFIHCFGFAVTSMLRALIIMQAYPPVLKNISALVIAISACFGCAISWYKKSTSSTMCP